MTDSAPTGRGIFGTVMEYEAAKAAAIECRAAEHGRDERLQLAVALLSNEKLATSPFGPRDAIHSILAPVAAWVETGKVTR